MIERFLGDRDPKLASWLRSRADHEVLIQLEILEITAWDYRARIHA